MRHEGKTEQEVMQPGGKPTARNQLRAEGVRFIHAAGVSLMCAIRAKLSSCATAYERPLFQLGGEQRDATPNMGFPRLLQQLLDRGPEARRRGVRSKTGGRVAGAVDQELGEIPLDGPGAEQPALLVLQVLVERMGA